MRANSYALSIGEESQELFNMEFKQRTVIATWLLELKLNTLEDAQLQAKLKNDQVLLQKVNQLEKEFFLFIENERKNLNEESIFQIL